MLDKSWSSSPVSISPPSSSSSLFLPLFFLFLKKKPVFEKIISFDTQKFRGSTTKNIAGQIKISWNLKKINFTKFFNWILSCGNLYYNYKPGVGWWHKIGHLDAVFQIIFRHGIRSSRNFNYWAVIEIFAKQCRINGGRHQNYPQIRIGVNHITKNNHDKIWTDISFVDFIYDDMRHTPNRKRKFKYLK